MSQPNNKKLKIMILEDEEDILILYKDFLVGKGYEITTTYKTGDEVINEIDSLRSDIYMIDFRLPGNKNGFDIAIEILTRFPSAPILFITAYEHLHKEISENPVFYNKNIEVLVKPVKLDIIESTIFHLVNKFERMSKNYE
ncbi:MAG TPA: response regulator [Nitrososphaeraceae archaeon]|jgi:DNA-binding NtrC family response regulator